MTRPPLTALALAFALSLLPLTPLPASATLAPPLPASEAASPYQTWSNGPPKGEGFFALAVWLQNPSRAERYKALGINTYVGLWRGPTAAQLDQLREAGMYVICHQNDLARSRADDPTIIGWMHGDEPDNAQSLGEGRGYGPPILPEVIVRDYEALRETDPTRPVFLNLGQGVAWDQWHGRGVRTNRPEDYPEYIQGSDIVSFDIYPATHSHPDVAGNLAYVARGVDRLVRWSEGRKIVWNCIEASRINHPENKPSPRQLESEVWMAIIHGSMGIVYFVHEWEPQFNESALLDDAELGPAVAEVNALITRLAPVLNGPTLEGAVAVEARPVAAEAADASGDGPAIRQVTDEDVAVLVKQRGEDLVLFAVEMRGRETEATLTLAVEDRPGPWTVEQILGDGGAPSRLEAGEGLKVRFSPWRPHIYRLRPAGQMGGE